MNTSTGEQMVGALTARLAAIDMSQAEFARKAGVSPKHVNQVLSGKASAPVAAFGER